MGQQEYDNFKRLIKEWLDSHPNEYADFVEEMNDKKFKGFFNIFNTAVRLVPKYKEAARKRIGDDRNPDFEELENVLLQSDLAEKIVNEFHTPNKRSIVPAMLAWLYYGRSYECMVEQGEELTKRKDIPTLYKWLVSGMVKFIIRKSIANGMRTKEDWQVFRKQQKAIEENTLVEWAIEEDEDMDEQFNEQEIVHERGIQKAYKNLISPLGNSKKLVKDIGEAHEAIEELKAYLSN